MDVDVDTDTTVDRMGSSGSNLMMVAPTATANEASPAPTSRAFPSKDTANTEPFQLNARLPPTATAEPSRFSFGATGNQHSSTSDADSPTTPAERATDGFDFVPTMNFDDFQNSIVDPDWTSPMLGEFPGVSGGRALPRVPKERESGGGSGQVVKGTGNGNGNGFVSTRPAQLLKLERGTAQEDRGAVGRTPSFSRRRISVAPTGTSRNAAGQSGTATAGIPTSASQPNLSLRTRRQSTVPPNSQPSNSQTSTTTLTQQTPPSAGTGGSRAPHKSLGPGLITSMMDRKASTQQATPSTPGDGLKPALSHSSSLSRARRTTMQPSASAGAELPRLSTLAANNANTKSQSRANRVRSMMQPPPPNSYRGLPDTPDTAGHSRAVSKGAFTSKDQTHTPSSSASKRQSTAANMGGRASGLGARTISPTDARRLKRMSMMPAPPMPTTLPKEAPPAPPTHTPRLTQPSPSLIPVKAQSATPTVGHAHSAGEGRAASPVDIRRELPALPGLPLGTGVMSGSLSSKSSYQSLASNTGSNGNGSGHGSGSGSNSRLPTPKAKQRSSSTGSLQWNSGEGREGYGEAYAGRGDLVPPVPAIPKVYESPKEPLTDPGSFPFFAETPRTSVDVPRSGGAATTIPKTGAQPARAEDATGGRRNNNLQPLRLPPMNLQPTLPRPSQELESRENYAQITAQTPEPRRMAKTPSTPMTASKATLFQRRQHEDQAFPAIRSSTSHYALRDVMGQQFDVEGALPGGGVRIPANLVGSGDVSGTGYGNVRQQQRSAITPFASGSLPKGEAEIARLRAGMPSGEGYQDDYDLGAYADGLQLQQARPMQGVTTRPKTSGNDSLPVEKKEGGLRRKLSLGWRRSSSKNGNALLAVDPAKGSPLLHGLPQETFEKEVMEKEKERLGPNRLRKRSAEMPPPATLPQGRPSLEAAARRKSTIAGTLLNGSVTSQQQQQAAPHGAPAGNVGNSEQQLMTITGSGAAKTRALHSEQPQPVPPPPAAATRASSWGHFGSRTAVLGKPAATTTSTAAAPKHKFTASTLSAIVKDKDDLAADDEMRRLSQKRRDVDAAAKESEALKLRAVARTPVSPERVLVDRHVGLNIFERGEIVDYGQDGIYFTGTKNAKKIIGSLSGGGDSSAEKDAQAGNYGYDDERGDYNIVMGDHLAYRYEVVDLLGKGSFGQVVRCVDHKEGGVVAVKIIRNKKRFHQQALVEVGILGKLREWVSLSSIITSLDYAVGGVNADLSLLCDRTRTKQTPPSPSPRASTSAPTSASSRPASPSTSTNSSARTTSRVSPSRSSAASPANSSPASSSYKKRKSSTATSSPRTSSSAKPAKPMCGLLTLGVRAARRRRCTRTSNPAFTGLRRLFWGVLTAWALICGRSAVFWRSFGRGTPSSPAKTSKNNSRVLWRYSARRTASWWSAARARSCSSTLLGNLASRYHLRGGGGGLVARLCSRRLRRRMRLLLILWRGVCVGIRRGG